MAIKASASVTLSCYRDTESVTRYYKLQSSTTSAPAKPTTNPPSGWDDAEPSYTSGSTNTLYFCDLTVFSDGTWAYSTVSKSSSYEAAKEAWNKAQNAQDAAEEASKVATNYMNFDETDGLVVGNMTADTLGNNVRIDSDSVDIRSGSNVLATFGTDTVIGPSSSTNVHIDSDSVDIRNGSAVLASYGANNAVIGKASSNNLLIDSDSVDIRSGSNVLATFTESKIELGKNSNTSVITMCNGQGVITTETETSDGAYSIEGISMESPFTSIKGGSGAKLSARGVYSLPNGNTGTDNMPDVIVEAGRAEDGNSDHACIIVRSDNLSHSPGVTGVTIAARTANGGSKQYWFGANGVSFSSPLDITSGGTGATTAVGATTNLGAMRSTYKNGYAGLTTAGGSDTDWIRTTSAGLLPYQSGGGSSQLGTSGWPFSKVYSQNYYGGGDILLFRGNVLYKGNLAAGGSFETALYKSYKCFVAILSNWVHVMGYRWDANAGISMSGMTDEGTGSWSHKASFSAVGLENGNVKLTLVAASTHKILGSGTGHEGYTRNVLYVLGIF